MKIITLIIITFFLNDLVFAQNNIIYKDTLINKIDSNGVKNGLWIEFVNPELIIISPIISRGYYENNKKVGLWYYYHSNSDLSGLKNIIDYKNNGDIVIDFGNKLIINKDSTKLTFYNPIDLCIECKKIKINKFQCIKYKKNGAVYRKRYFSSFEECLLKYDTHYP